MYPLKHRTEDYSKKTNPHINKYGNLFYDKGRTSNQGDNGELSINGIEVNDYLCGKK